jgi:hypothetical protein
MVLAIAWQRFFALAAHHACHKLSDIVGLSAKKSRQSFGPFVAKTDDDSRTISMFFISLNTDE